VFLLISALGLGFLHGLGGDHLMAIAALSVDGAAEDSAAVRRGHALSVAMRFALGHAVLLALGAGLVVLIGWSIPPHIERGGELLGGGLLIVMGVVTLQHLRQHPRTSGRTRTRTSTRTSTRTEHRALSTEHPAPSTQHSRHSHLPTIIGAAFAISSLRALAMLTPFGRDLRAEPLPLLLGLIVVFAVGILASMSLFGIALAGVLSTRVLQRVGHGAGALVALSSIVLGIAWVATA
jgi:nickel/cobalt transporter (NicO) family protein